MSMHVHLSGWDTKSAADGLAKNSTIAAWTNNNWAIAVPFCKGPVRQAAFLPIGQASHWFGWRKNPTPATCHVRRYYKTLWLTPPKPIPKPIKAATGSLAALSLDCNVECVVLIYNGRATGRKPGDREGILYLAIEKATPPPRNSNVFKGIPALARPQQFSVMR